MRLKKKWVLIAVLLMICVCTQAQTIVTGTVTDQNGETVPGVNVTVKGTTTGIITDANGKYSLTVPKADNVLVFSFIGFKTQEITAGNRTVIDVRMVEDTQVIDEVVVIGYGVAKKSDLTGAVARADLSTVQNTPTVNIAQGIKGAVPGLNIGYGSNNRAGNSDDIAISIRGRNSLSGTTSPLIVVDGVIFRGGINDINPNDIESIDVLKDASSAAIYGSQAANGVLMITTKSVKTVQKPVIEYNGNFALQKLTNENMKGVNRADYVWQIESHALEQSRLAPDYLQPNPNWDITSRFRLASQFKGWKEGTDTDWWGMGTNDTPYIQDHTISIRGRGDAVNYYMSYGFMDQKNLIINDTYKRQSLRVNLDTKITNWLTIGTQTFFTIHDTSGQSPDMASVTSEIPIMAAYDDDGNIIRRLDRGSINILVIPDNKDLDMRYNLSGNFYGDVKIPFVEGLSYRVQYNQSLTFTRAYRFDYTANTDQGQGYKNYSNRNEWVLDHIVKYIRKFGQHSVDATFVYGLEKRVYDSTNSTANYFVDQSLNYNKLSAGRSDQNAISSSAWKESSLWLMGRMVYGFKDRYIMTATIRHDGFSGFGENYKTGNFPSLAFAWRISEENFFKNNVSFVDNLKLRASYGKSGNRTAGRYATMAQMGVYNPFRQTSGSDSYVFGDGGTPELVRGVKTMSNPNLRWETTGQYNLGVDFSVLSGRLSGNYEFYYSKTTDLLYNISIPSINGAYTTGTDGLEVQVASNIGKMQNIGHEVSITGIPVMNKNFNWTVTGNFAINFNKVISIYGRGPDGKEQDLINAKIFMGHPFGVAYDYHIIGMWQLDDYYAGRIPKGAYFGTYKVEDLNGDGDLKPETDRKILGYTEPLYNFSIRNTLTYKGFDFKVFIYSIQGGKDHYLGRPLGDGFGEMNMDYYPNVKHDWWMPENPNARYKRISVVDARVANLTPYVSRSFIRLQEVSLTYNLPKSLLSKVGINRASVSISGTNLLTLTDWDGWDPEANQGLNAGITYPAMKNYAFGINFEF